MQHKDIFSISHHLTASLFRLWHRLLSTEHIPVILKWDHSHQCWRTVTNTLNSALNPTCHLLTLLGAHHILHVSRIRVRAQSTKKSKLHAIFLFCWWEICVQLQTPRKQFTVTTDNMPVGATSLPKPHLIATYEASTAVAMAMATQHKSHQACWPKHLYQPST